MEEGVKKLPQPEKALKLMHYNDINAKKKEYQVQSNKSLC